MKYQLLAVGATALLLTACAGTRHEENAFNEPAGNSTNEMTLPTTPGRDINQRPYPGVSPTFDEQRELGPRTPGVPPSGSELENEQENGW